MNKREMQERGWELPPVFIASYHRPDEIRSVKTFKELGYPASLLNVMIDDEAGDEEAYREACRQEGVALRVFSQKEAREEYDFVTRPLRERRSGGIARNQAWKLAASLGAKQFVVVDDDTRHFEYRPFGLWACKLKGEEGRRRFLSMVHSLAAFQRSHRLGVVGIAQTGETFASLGDRGPDRLLARRKVMNFCMYLTDFVHGGEVGQMDCDTLQYLHTGGAGLLTLSLRSGIVLQQVPSPQKKGGEAATYRHGGMVTKVANDVICYPSAVVGEVQPMNGNKLHHKISNRYAYPCLLRRPAGEGNNIAWDTYQEDMPFTSLPQRRWHYVED